MSIQTILYDAAGHDREIGLEKIDISSLSGEQILWVDLTGSEASKLPSEMQQALARTASDGRLEIFDDFYRFDIPSGERPGALLHFAAGPSWVLTSSEQRPKFFDNFVENDQGETLKGKMTSTAFVASLLMRHLDAFREEIASVDTAIDKLDETILRSREKRSPLSSLAALRRRVADLRATLIEHRTVIHGLVAPDFLAHVAKTDHDFLTQVYRVFEKLEDDVARARETVIGSFELYASRVAQDTNQLLKVLTIATVITGVVGAVAGVFGMNFNTPIPNSGLDGFLMVTGAMIAASVGIVALAIWRRWV